MKISVISSAGKEAVLVILGPRSFFGEGSLVGQPFRVSSAIALEPSTLFRVEKRAMLRALSSQHQLSEEFIASLLVRNIDLEEDLRYGTYYRAVFRFRGGTSRGGVLVLLWTKQGGAWRVIA